jgi:hypothetical protein
MFPPRAPFFGTTCWYRDGRSGESAVSPPRHEPDRSQGRRARDRPPEGLLLDVVREPAAAVDLDDRDPLAVGCLEIRIAVDRDLAQVEAELVVRLGDDATRRLAEMAARRGVEDDVGYG